jgi:hypothetical protein
VVLWLFVLVPMLINRRDTVRRTSDVALATRVLNSGAAARLLRRRGGPAAGHRSDPDWRREADDEAEGFEDDEERTGPVVVTSKPPRTVAVVTSLAEEELDYLDVDVVEEDSGALKVGSVSDVAEPVSAPSPERQTDELPLEFASAPTESVRTAAADDAPVDGAAAESEPSAPAEQVDAPTATESRDDGTADEYEYVEDSSGLEPEAEDPAPAVAHPSRAHATKTSAAVSARKYRFRTRMLLSMAAILVGSAVAAFLLTPTAWYVCAGMAAVTLLYLAYLRRQTRIEERLRQRRIQRLARARAGVESAHDHEFDVVPTRLRRPGAAVLEIDDEDPVFEHLEYVAFTREFDMPRAAGQ